MNQENLRLTKWRKYRDEIVKAKQFHKSIYNSNSKYQKQYESVKKILEQNNKQLNFDTDKTFELNFVDFFDISVSKKIENLYKEINTVEIKKEKEFDQNFFNELSSKRFENIKKQFLDDYDGESSVKLDLKKIELSDKNNEKI